MARRTDRRRYRKAEAARQVKRRRQACRSQAKATGPRPMPFGPPACQPAAERHAVEAPADSEPTSRNVARSPEPRTLDLSLLSWRTHLDPRSAYYQSPMGEADVFPALHPVGYRHGR
jgi:hypothetical protein